MEKLRVKFTDRLTPKQIIDIVDEYKKDTVPEVELREAYAKGNNPAILARVVPSSAPDNKIPVPYGRRILNIITSYMYLPGLISYSSDDQGYLNSLKEIFDYNDEELESYRIGWDTSLHGMGYEMLFNEGVDAEETMLDGQPGFGGVMPRFERVSLSETIPLYNYDIVPKLQAFIRFFTIPSEETEYISIYYADIMQEYERRKNTSDPVMVREQKHGYSDVPLVVYENNEDLIGDFSAVQSLIDAYDVLISDSMNEFDRFAQAYLVAKGFAITAEDVDKLKHKRAFSLLNADDSIEFLTKQIEVAFIQFMSEQLRAEIHRGAGIPNLDDYKWGGGASGETIDKFIYLMELFTGVKEAYFKRGLAKRIDLISEYRNLAGDSSEIDILMKRNDPDKSQLQADLFTKYSGHISEKTLIENFADFVKDAEEELENLQAEKDANVERFYQNAPVAEEDGEDTEEQPGNTKEEIATQ